MCYPFSHHKGCDVKNKVCAKVFFRRVAHRLRPRIARTQKNCAALALDGKPIANGSADFIGFADEGQLAAVYRIKQPRVEGDAVVKSLRNDKLRRELG